jgi:flagellar hook protein FlgE
MGSAISIGTTGLTASSKQMDVIGNNLANSNTLGFKAGNTYFASMLNQSLSSSGSMAVGQGVAVAAVATQFSQGSFETTGNATDLAIDGDGFFVVKDDNDAAYYTRAGAFHVSKEGLLVDGNNYRVQGFGASTSTLSVSTDTEAEKPQNISFDNAMSNARATTEVSIGANLDDNTLYGEKFNVSQNVFDSRGQIHNLSITFLKTEGNGVWGFDAKLDDTNLSDTTEQQACGVTFDKNGALLGMFTGTIPNPPATDHGTAASVGTFGTDAFGATGMTVTKPGQLFKDATGISLTKEAPAGVWTVTTQAGYEHAIAWQEAIDGNEILKVDLDGKGGSDIAFDLGPTTGNDWLAGNTVTFDVTKTDVDLTDITLTFGQLSSNPSGEVSTIGLTSGTGTATKNKINWDMVGDTAKTVTGYASSSVLKSLSDNGYTFGVLKSLNVENDGVINGFFTNGQTSKLGQLILASFRDPSGLKKIGNYFGATSSSGEAITNKAGSSGLGEIMNHSLEISNTDVAKEFINMITAQRAYQASSRIITTADQMLTELMNNKR